MINRELVVESWETLPPRLAYEAYWTGPGLLLPKRRRVRICGVQHMHDVLASYHLCISNHTEAEDNREVDLCVAHHFGLTYKQVARVRVRNDNESNNRRRYQAVKATLFDLIVLAEAEHTHAAREAERIIQGTGFFTETKVATPA